MSQAKDDDICQPDSEKELICKVKNGDKEALNAFVLRFSQDIYRYALHLIHDGHAAEDVTQEAMIAAIKNIGDFEDRGIGVKPWLFKITKNEARKYNRHNHRNSYVSTDCVADIQCEAKTVDDIDLEDLKSLSEDEKRALTLRYLDGLSHDQVAEKMAVSVPTVFRRLRNAKRRLKEIFLREYNP